MSESEAVTCPLCQKPARRVLVELPSIGGNRAVMAFIECPCVPEKPGFVVLPNPGHWRLK